MIKSAKTGKEIVITSQNKVGALSNVAKLLADRGINIVALSAQAAGGVALMNLVVDEHLRASDLLKKKGIAYQVHDVVLLEVEDRPGALKHITQKLAAKKIDLLNIYGSTAATYAPCLLVVSSNNNQKTIVALKK